MNIFGSRQILLSKFTIPDRIHSRPCWKGFPSGRHRGGDGPVSGRRCGRPLRRGLDERRTVFGERQRRADPHLRQGDAGTADASPRSQGRRSHPTAGQLQSGIRRPALRPRHWR